MDVSFSSWMRVVGFNSYRFGRHSVGSFRAGMPRARWSLKAKEGVVEVATVAVGTRSFQFFSRNASFSQSSQYSPLLVGCGPMIISPVLVASPPPPMPWNTRRCEVHKTGGRWGKGKRRIWWLPPLFYGGNRWMWLVWRNRFLGTDLSHPPPPRPPHPSSVASLGSWLSFALGVSWWWRWLRFGRRPRLWSMACLHTKQVQSSHCRYTGYPPPRPLRLQFSSASPSPSCGHLRC